MAPFSSPKKSVKYQVDDSDCIKLLKLALRWVLSKVKNVRTENAPDLQEQTRSSGRRIRPQHGRSNARQPDIYRKIPPRVGNFP